MTCDILNRVPPNANQRASYGPMPENFIEFRFPRQSGPRPVLLVFHGGFWQGAYLQEIQMKNFLKTASGFGGCNAAIVIGKE
jgi:hypothetical protein